MRTITVSFFGHRRISGYRCLEEQVESIVCRLLGANEYLEFLVGRNGDFDRLVSSTIRRIKKECGFKNCALVWVMPYMLREYEKNEASFHAYYDEIEICDEASAVHFKEAYTVRNQRMIDRSDIVVIHAVHTHGGAYQALMYAQKTQKHIIRIG